MVSGGEKLQDVEFWKHDLTIGQVADGIPMIKKKKNMVFSLPSMEGGPPQHGR